MIITCNKCSTSFNLDDSLVKESGSKCRCTVCNHVFTAYPMPLEPKAFEPETSEPEPWEVETREPEIQEPEASEPEPWEVETQKPEIQEPQTKAPEPWDIEQTPEKASDFDFESEMEDDDLFKEPSDLEIEDFDLSSKDSDLDMEDLDFSSKDSDLDMENPYLDIDETDLEIDDDFSLNEDLIDKDEESLSQKKEVSENSLEFEDDEIKFDPIEDEPVFLDEPGDAADSKFLAVKDLENLTIEDPEPLDVEKQEPQKEEPQVLHKPDKDDAEALSVTPGKTLLEEKETILEKDETKEVDPPPKKERKVIVKPKPAVTSKPKPVLTAKPKPKKKKKKSAFKTIVIILMLVFLLAIGAYIASVMTGYRLPAIDQYIKKPIPEISEVKPLPNQKSVNGRFVTNTTAGTLFIITGRVENPSDIAYSHIEIRGALITKNKEEAKIKNVFCGNIITEEMLKTGNISDINTLLNLKEGAHKINVNIAPGASVPFMVVFSDLPEKLHNFTVKVAGFDKAIN